MNEIASCRGLGDRPHPKVGRAALLTSGDRNSPQPGFDPILNGAMHVLLLYAGVLWDLERMVTAFDDEQICEGSELGNNRL
jgi:hypothetical protein